MLVVVVTTYDTPFAKSLAFAASPRNGPATQMQIAHQHSGHLTIGCMNFAPTIEASIENKKSKASLWRLHGARAAIATRVRLNAALDKFLKSSMSRPMAPIGATRRRAFVRGRAELWMCEMRDARGAVEKC